MHLIKFKNHNNTKYIIYHLIGFLTPLVLITYTCIKFPSFNINSLINYYIFLLLIISILLQIKNKIFYSISLLFFNFSFFILIFIDFFYAKVFSSRITESTLHIILETNKNESIEFLTHYFRSDTLLLLLLNTIIIFYCFFLSTRTPLNHTKQNKNVLKFITLILITPLLFFRIYFLPYVILKSTIIYHNERKKISNIKTTIKGEFKNVCSTSNSKEEIAVIVIGESTTRNHLALHGYKRNNNPLLSKLDLKVFKNVVSPHTHTITSLGKVLTLGDYHIPKKKYNSTIIQLFNSANFETYFISNQKPIGLYETTTMLISKTSTNSYFTNTSDSTYDSIIFPHLDKVLNDNKEKKFIIIHLMGTHIKYSNRYPNNFNFFKDNPITNFNHELAYKTINEYDNAILYNDYIVYSIIKKIESKNALSYVLYFSDHGEDVYDTINEASHSEKKGTNPMYEIPFILWQSKKHLNQSKNLVFDVERYFNTEDLIHSVSDLSKLKFDRLNPQKSIFNIKYTNSTQ